MISIVKTDVIKNKENNTLFIGELRGMSTDEKPTTIDGKEIGNGTFYVCIDNGDIYMFDGENKQWHKI